MKFKIIGFYEINSICNYKISTESIKDYLNGGRQDILYNTDIFCENVRTIDRTDKDFSIFEMVDYIDDSVILVFSIYLELYEYSGKMIEALKAMEYYSEKYPNNKIVFSYNHDVDFARYNSIVEKYTNVFILNYNTSHPSKNDILLPFWTIGSENFSETKDQFCSFIGTIYHGLRYNLYNTFSTHPSYYFTNGLSNIEYKKMISRSIFSFAPRGIGLSSYRFYECLHSNTIPVLFADNAALPFEDIIEYSDICIRIPESKSTDFKYVDDILKNTDYKKNVK